MKQEKESVNQGIVNGSIDYRIFSYDEILILAYFVANFPLILFLHSFLEEEKP